MFEPNEYNDWECDVLTSQPKIIIPTLKERRAFPDETKFYITRRMINRKACPMAVREFKYTFGGGLDNQVPLTYINLQRMENAYSGATSWLMRRLIRRICNNAKLQPWHDETMPLYDLNSMWHSPKTRYRNLVALALIAKQVRS